MTKNWAISLFFVGGLAILFHTWKFYTSYTFSYVKIPSPSLQSGILNNAEFQDGFVMLPRGYSNSQKDYPIVYYLHGFGGSASTAEEIAKKIRWLQLLNFKKDQQFILIGFNGRHQMGGSFYTNSPVIGNWQDYVVQDVYNFARSNYRVSENSECSFLFGFSMGGFAALNIGLKYPEKYKHVFALSAGLFGPQTVYVAAEQWKKDGLVDLIESYAAAFAPKGDLSEQRPYYHFDSNDTSIIQLWNNGLGNWEHKLKAYRQQEEKLSSIRIEYGSKDYFWWIKDGAEQLSKLLTEQNIEHEIHDHGEGHRQDFKQIKHLLNFINESSYSDI